MTSPTVPMISPDGKESSFVPRENIQVAASDGAIPALVLRAPDGSRHAVPIANIAGALKDGGMTEGQYQASQAGGTKNAPPLSYQGQSDQLYNTSPSDSPLTTALKSAGATISAPFVHPLNTLSGLVKTMTPDTGVAGALEGLTPAGPALASILLGQGNQIANDYQQGGAGYAASKLAGALTGTGVLGLGTAGLAKGVGAVADTLPSASRAGATFNSLNADLANQPVTLAKSLEPLQRATELGVRGRSIPGPVRAILERSQAIEPMTYPEARDYQSALSDLSANDKMSMSGSMKAQVARLGQGFFDDIQSAAEQAGRGHDYADAMKEYRQASTLKDSAKAALKLGLAAGGLAKGFSIFKELTGGK